MGVATHDEAVEILWNQKLRKIISTIIITDYFYEVFSGYLWHFLRHKDTTECKLLTRYV